MPRLGGRQKGTPNRQTKEAMEILAELGCDPIRGMARIAMNPKNSTDLRLRANAELAQYVYPKRKALEVRPLRRFPELNTDGCRRKGTVRFRGIEYGPLPSQLRFHECRSRFKGFSGPVGSGKSNALAQEAIRLAVVNAGLLGLVGAPTYPMLRDVTERAVLDVLEHNEIPHEFQKSERLLTLTELGSEIIFRTMEEPERLVGTNLAWFGVDELTYCRQDSFHRLQARLRHPHAKELCGFGVWTPNGFDWVYDKFIGASAKPGYTAILANPGENTHLPGDFYDRLVESYDERFAKQEVYGEYLSLTSGSAYYAFARELNVQDVKYNPALPICWSLDFNIDPMCSVISQIDTQTKPENSNWFLAGPPQDEETVKTISVLDEIWISGGTTPNACEEFLNRVEQITNDQASVHVRIYGDASGSARQTASVGATSDWEMVKRILGNHPHIKPTFILKRSNPPVRDRINAMNAALCNHNHERRLLIHPRCVKTIRDLERVSVEARRCDPRQRYRQDADAHVRRSGVSG